MFYKILINTRKKILVLGVVSEPSKTSFGVAWPIRSHMDLFGDGVGSASFYLGGFSAADFFAFGRARFAQEIFVQFGVWFSRPGDMRGEEDVATSIDLFFLLPKSGQRKQGRWPGSQTASQTASQQDGQPSSRAARQPDI